MANRISDWELRQYIKKYSEQHGIVSDETRFLNDMRLMFYPDDSNGLFQRCMENGFIKSDLGNVIIKIKS